ncbi:hypothetical protein NEOLEDRAFT_1178006 [Neolentinus lepideus HHB14362 ss-1]|uniref:Velvet domain-containing protein n=1 Tax=Neolentinus lepideus HHB14362 ss-1 TaxID=1314782 RepID=A0A165SYN4_9AGAM|nr:hypothetical protein NEOLEDRAFT_1178006 [Neolentinus lepideus HHB14362 ss-1]
MCQELKQACMCGVGGTPFPFSHAQMNQYRTTDRRPIDPTTIVQLRVHNPAAPREPHSPASSDSSASDLGCTPRNPRSPSHAASFLQNPYYFMFVSLAKPDEYTELHWLKDGAVD